MPRVEFTPHLRMHLDCPAVTATGTTVREVLDKVFVGNPRLRGYVLDDQHCLRKHVVIFINGTMIQDRAQLSDPVDEASEVYVMQALSGG